MINMPIMKGNFHYEWTLSKGRAGYRILLNIRRSDREFEQLSPRILTSCALTENRVEVDYLDQEMVLDLHRQLTSLLGQVGVLETKPTSKGLGTLPLP